MSDPAQAVAEGKKPKALVTGANGFMGTHMVDLLVAQGYEVLATDIGSASSKVLSGVSLEYAQCDLRDPSQVVSLHTRGPFDYVFHIAGLFDYSAPLADLHEVNVQGTYNLLWELLYDRGRGRFKSPAEMPKRVVMWGAAGVYDFSKGAPVKEDTPTIPSGGYLYTKWCAEKIAMQMCELGVPVTIVRPGGVYGPRSRYGVALSILIAARGGMGPFYFGSKKNVPGMVHVIDVCRAAEFLAKRPEAVGEIYNVNDESSYTVYDLTTSAAKRLGFPMIPLALPLGIQRFFIGNLKKKAAKKNRISSLNEEMLSLLELDSLLDISKIKALGWRPLYPDTKKGFEETLDWYEKEGWL